MAGKQRRWFHGFDESLAIKYLGVILGIILTVIGLLCATYELPEKFIDYKIKESMVLSPESPIYQDWADPPVPLYMRFYIFNITNGPDVQRGEIPRVEECGPYTYKMFAPKVNVTFYPNDTVSYYNNYNLLFQADMSNGKENDVIFHLNVVLTTTAIMLEKVTALDPFGFINAMIENSGGHELIPNHTAKELLFGYRDPIFSTLASWSFITGHAEEYFGFLHGFNNSHDGLYLINTGKGNRQAFQISKWNGRESLPFWTTNYANMINGSDGSFLGNNLTPEDTPYLYFSQMCRSMKLEFERETIVRGIKTLKFHLADDFLANSTIYPDNAGFCVPTGNCFDSGILNLESCAQGASSFLSLPHFYNGAEEYRNAVIGLSPNKEKHDSVYHAEPKTGAVLMSHRRLQINFLLRPSRSIKSLRNVREVIFPMFWLSGSAEIHEEAAGKMRQAIGIGDSIAVFSYCVIFLGCLIMLISLCCLIRPKRLYIHYIKKPKPVNGETSQYKEKKCSAML